MKKIITLSVLISLALNSYADDAKPNLKLLKGMLQDGISVKKVSPAPVAGLYEVQLDNGIVYLSEDGVHVLSGDLYNLKDNFSYTEKKMNDVRKKALEKVKDSDKIIYKAPKEKYKVAVFTDINCGYCAKLHDQMDDYNKAGITIEYLAFPRQGIGSKNEREMQRVWCSKNKTSDLTAAKLKRKIPTESCEGKQVAEQFELGQEIGVYATPTMIFSDGELQAGYIAPDKLASMLNEKN